MTPRLLWRFYDGQEGATMLEYALVLALVVIGCLVSVQTIGNISQTFLGLASTI
jgi:Flp pilus assembly pilin Flp